MKIKKKMKFFEFFLNFFEFCLNFFEIFEIFWYLFKKIWIFLKFLWNFFEFFLQPKKQKQETCLGWVEPQTEAGVDGGPLR